MRRWGGIAVIGVVALLAAAAIVRAAVEHEPISGETARGVVERAFGVRVGAGVAEVHGDATCDGAPDWTYGWRAEGAGGGVYRVAIVHFNYIMRIETTDIPIGGGEPLSLCDAPTGGESFALSIEPVPRPGVATNFPAHCRQAVYIQRAGCRPLGLIYDLDGNRVILSRDR